MMNAVTTNGSMLNIQTDKFFRLVDTINVSIPAFDDNNYHKITKGISLDIVKNNVIAASKNGVNVKINAVYVQGNETSLLNMINFFHDYNITVKIMNDMFGDEEYYHEFMQYVSQWQNIPGIEIESGLNPGLEICTNCKIVRHSSCPSCRSIWIYPDRKITVCPFDEKRSFYCSDSDVQELTAAITSCWNIC